jgi:hypothetical protein
MRDRPDITTSYPDQPAPAGRVGGLGSAGESTYSSRPVLHVAITRGTDKTSLYLVDGALDLDDEADPRASEPERPAWTTSSTS